MSDVTQTPERYDVLDHNDEALTSTDLWWVAARSATYHGFRVRDNEDGSIQLDARKETTDAP